MIPGTKDATRVAQVFEVLSQARSIDLLRQLGSGASAQELQGDGNVAKMRAELGKLVAAGLVQELGGVRDGKLDVEYALKTPQIFALAHSLLELIPARLELDSGTHLEEVFGLAPGRRHRLNGARQIVGRAASAAVLLADPHVSQEHATIWEEDGWKLVTAASSRHPVKLNWEPVEPAQTVELCDGDLVEFGKTRLLFRVGPERRA